MKPLVYRSVNGNEVVKFTMEKTLLFIRVLDKSSVVIDIDEARELRNWLNKQLEDK